MQNGFSKILLTVILVVVIAGGFFAWQKFGAQKMQDETVDWQTYRNDEYKFEFKYPSIPTACKNCQIITDKTRTGYYEHTPPLFELNGTNLDIIGIGAQEFFDSMLDGRTIDEKKDFEISGRKATRFNYKYNTESRSTTIIEISYDRSISIDLGNMAEKNPCCIIGDKNYQKDVYEGILSTFRFLE